MDTFDDDDDDEQQQQQQQQQPVSLLYIYIYLFYHIQICYFLLFRLNVILPKIGQAYFHDFQHILYFIGFF